MKMFTAAEIQAVEKERKAKNILMTTNPKDNKIRTRKVYGQRFYQQLLSQLEAHGAEVSTEDANHKFLRSLPSAWSNLAMTMRTNPEIDNLSIDYLYNNLRVFEQEIQGASKTSSSAQNVLYVFLKAKAALIKKERFLLITTKAGNKKESDGFLQTKDDGIVNLGINMTEVEETNHALMATSSSNEQLSLNEKLAFQANEIHEKDEKLKRYRRIGMRAVKEKEQLQKIVDSWKDSSKNLWRLINSGMSSTSKIGLGYEIKSNDEVLSYEEEMNFSVFKCSKNKMNQYGSLFDTDIFTKTNEFKGVPPPLSGDYTPQPQEEIDDTLYVYGKKGPQKPEISVSDKSTSEHSSCQSNDSEGSCENISEHSFETESESLSEPNEMPKSRLEENKEKDVSAPKSKEEHPLKNMVDRGIFDSGCSGHMTGNKDQLEDFERNSMDELLLWSSKMLHYLHNVLFTETEFLLCLSDFKMPDEKQDTYSKFLDTYNITVLTLKNNLLPSSCKRVEENQALLKFLEDKPNVKGVGYRWMFDIDYLSDSMNYIPVSLENQANPHAGTSEVTNNAGTPTSIASEEKDEQVELIVVPSAVRIPEEKDESRTSSTNSKKEVSSTDSLEDNPKIQAFRRELNEVALKHLGTVPENNTTSTSSVNTGSHTVNPLGLNMIDSHMPEASKSYHKPETRDLEEAIDMMMRV
ncbi:hypothetical protein Tco_0077360 [Tanacetum coccineum]